MLESKEMLEVSLHPEGALALGKAAVEGSPSTPKGDTQCLAPRTPSRPTLDAAPAMDATRTRDKGTVSDIMGASIAWLKARPSG